jgi:Family of unknown function (DUF6496)
MRHVPAVPASFIGTAAERTTSKVSFPRSGRVGRRNVLPPFAALVLPDFFFLIHPEIATLRRAFMPRKKSTGRKSSGRKYSKKAGEAVKREMHKMKRGTLKSGSSGKKVKSRKQAIAIGLSEARRSGAKVPKKKS